MHSCYLCKEHIGKKNTPATHFCKDCEEKDTGVGYLCDHCEAVAKTIQIDYDEYDSNDNEIIYEHPHSDEHSAEKLVCETCDYNISTCVKAQVGLDCSREKRDEYTCQCGWGYSECVCIRTEPKCKPEKRCSKCEWPCAYCTCV